MARTRRSGEEFVLAAAGIVAESGWESLTAKSLAERLGVHSTAVYRHFGTWDDLVVAVFDLGLGQLLEAGQSLLAEGASPRDRILASLRAFRAAADADPFVADCFAAILTAGTVAQTPNADALTTWLVQQLEEWGVPRAQVPAMHQALENLVIGGIFCDYASHPDHVSLRRQRRRMTGIPAFEEFTRSDEACAQIGTEAFELSARLLLDECDRLASVR